VKNEKILDCFTLKKEGLRFFETSATAVKPTRRNIQEDFTRKQHRSERRRSRVMCSASLFNISMGANIDIKNCPNGAGKLLKTEQ
jgi:hypothetical protein